MKFFLSILIFFSFLFSSSLIYSQSSLFQIEGDIIHIELKGLNVIEKGLIYSILKSQINDSLSPRIVIEDIKSLYQLGFFKDIQVSAEKSEKGVVLSFLFEEKPRISKIHIDGNNEFSDKTILEKLTTYVFNILDLKKIKQDLKLIYKEYADKGYYTTKVSYKITPINEKFVELTYLIQESPKVFLTDIHVTGTNFYYPLDIQRIIQSSEIECFSWITDSGIYQEDTINQDLQIIAQNYLMNGFINVKIDKPRITLIRNPDFSRIVVDLNIQEGDQYFVGNIDIISDDESPLIVDKKELLEKVLLKTGDVFNPFEQNQSQFKLNEVYQERGYAFSIVRIDNKMNDEEKTVDITFKITRKEIAYIRRIEIHGNYETRDYVIRREFTIHDNELYNGVKLRESLLNVQRLGYFTPGFGVKDEQYRTDDYELDYNILLEETQTGSFNAALTYSEQVGVSLNLSVSKGNFMGKGQTLSFSANFANKGQQEYRISFTEPYLLGIPLNSNISVFYEIDPGDDEYDERIQGFSYGISYPIWKDWRAFGRYSFKSVNYYNITSEGEEELEGKEETLFKSIRTGLSYNTINNPRFPSKGYEASLFLEQVGGPLGGEEEFRRYDFNTRYFKALTKSERVIFMAKYGAAFLEQSNPDKIIPSTHRFEIGGITTVRGFEYREIEGPSSSVEWAEGFTTKQLKTDASNDIGSAKEDYDYYKTHQGGIIQQLFTLELLFPITREGQNMRGVIFYDMGNVWAEDRMYEITGANKNFLYFRKSIGAGIRLITPMGVLRFEYGIKLDPKKTESPGKFEFHISGLF